MLGELSRQVSLALQTVLEGVFERKRRLSASCLRLALTLRARSGEIGVIEFPERSRSPGSARVLRTELQEREISLRCFIPIL